MKKFGNLLLEIILMLPSGFVFGVVTPLYLIHLDLASTGKMDVFFKDANWSLPIGEVVV
jgi:hypothetical protein